MNLKIRVDRVTTVGVRNSSERPVPRVAYVGIIIDHDNCDAELYCSSAGYSPQEASTHQETLP